MTKDNSTGKNKDFYELGKKMFDRLNPQIAHNPKVVGPVQEPVAWMIYTKDGQSVYVTDNPTNIQEGQRALPLFTTPPAAQPAPDAIHHTDRSESPDYRDGWNDCRQAMLEMRKP